MVDLRQLIYRGDLTKPALVAGPQTISYHQLISSIEALAHAFSASGIQPTQRIGLFLYNCPELIYAYYACWQIGATAVAINNRLKAPEIARMLAQSKPHLIFTEGALAAQLKAAKPNCPVILINELAQLTRQATERIAQPVSALANEPMPATIHFTSGATAQPKGVVHSQAVLPLLAKTAATALGYQPEDELLISQSLMHGFGFSMQLLPGLLAGATLHLLPQFAAAVALRLITHMPISVICLLPGFCFQLLQQTGNRRVANQLRYCIVAGDMAPRALQERFWACFGIPISVNYGMTEALLFTLNLYPSADTVGSVGQPLADVHIKIMDEQGAELPIGVIGEVWVSSPHMFSGYLFPVTPRPFPSSGSQTFLPTGDLGCLDQHGNLWLKGRRKLLISRGGSKFAPQEVEAACYQHPTILEAGVVGVEQEGQPTNVIAYLVSNQPVDERAFSAFLHRQLADYKCPDRLIFQSSLPKTASGKLDRARLLKLATQITTPLIFN